MNCHKFDRKLKSLKTKCLFVPPNKQFLPKNLGKFVTGKDSKNYVSKRSMIENTTKRLYQVKNRRQKRQNKSMAGLKNLSKKSQKNRSLRNSSELVGLLKKTGKSHSINYKSGKSIKKRNPIFRSFKAKRKPLFMESNGHSASNNKHDKRKRYSMNKFLPQL